MNKKILICEDDTVIRNSLLEAFAAEPFEIVLARDGEESLQIATQNKPDIIILDISIAKLDGMEVMDRFREQYDRERSIPIIILSNLNDYDRMMMCVVGNDISFRPLRQEYLPVGVVQKVKETFENMRTTYKNMCFYE
jgi:DNA-binding response OmpR family regulator